MMKCEYYCRYEFEHGISEIHVKSYADVRRGTIDRAQAFEADDESQELRRIVNDVGNQLETLDVTAEGAASSLSEGLEKRYGTRKRGPIDVPHLTSPLRIVE